MRAPRHIQESHSLDTPEYNRNCEYISGDAMHCFAVARSVRTLNSLQIILRRRDARFRIGACSVTEISIHFAACYVIDTYVQSVAKSTHSARVHTRDRLYVRVGKKSTTIMHELEGKFLYDDGMQGGWWRCRKILSGRSRGPYHQVGIPSFHGDRLVSYETRRRHPSRYFLRLAVKRKRYSRHVP